MLVGLVLYVHVSLAVLTDVVAGEGSVWSLVLLGAALLSLVVGAWRGHAYALILGFPGALAGTLTLLEQTKQALFFGAVSWLFWIASLATFVLSASVWITTRRRPSAVPVVRGVVASPHMVPDGLHRTLSLYGVLGAAGLLVPVSVLVLRGDTGPLTRWRPVPHHLLVILVWSIALYTVWITPILNLEANAINDGRALRRGAKADAERPLWRRLLSLVWVAAALIGLWMW